ncbi:MAG: hypothetical protein SPL37_06105 [Prevotella sp.]|nr:hypothetical protein [Prevotella sp.]
MKRLIACCMVMMLMGAVAYAWAPQAWRKYVVSLEVKQDTVPQSSVMLCGLRRDAKIDSKAYQCGTYYFYQPGIFEEEDDRRQTERIMSGDYTTGDFIVDAIFDTIGLFVK